MAVDRFIIIRNVHLEGKNSLIATKKITSIHFAESQKIKRGQKMKSIVNSSTKTEDIKMKRKFGKVQINDKEVKFQLVGWLFGFYGISTFVGYLMPNPIFMKIILFQTIQFSISMQFKCK